MADASSGPARRAARRRAPRRRRRRRPRAGSSAARRRALRTAVQRDSFHGDIRAATGRAGTACKSRADRPAGLRQYGSTPAMTCHSAAGPSQASSRAVWIDTHCHLDAAEFDADRDAVVARARAAGVAQIVLPAVDAANFERGARAGAPASALPTRSASIRCASSAPATPTWRRCATRSRAMRDDPRLVAVGEIGLDHFVAGPRPRAAGAILRRAARARRRVRAAGAAARARARPTRCSSTCAGAACPAASPMPSTAASSRPTPSSSSAFGSASAAR